MQPKYDSLSHRVDGIGFEAWKEYNEAMFGWLSNIGKFRGGAPYGTIPVVMATPEKAFAKSVSGQNEGQPDIPIISFYLSTIALDFDKRGLVPGHILIEKWKQNGINSDQWQRRAVSIPVTLSYSVSLWAKHYFEISYVSWSLLTRFSPNSFIVANGAVNPIFFESQSDASDLEPGVVSDRILRHDFSFRVEGWLPRQHFEYDSLRKINIGFTDAEEDEINEMALFPDYTPKDNEAVLIVAEDYVQQDPQINYGVSAGIKTREKDISQVGFASDSNYISSTGLQTIMKIIFLNENDPDWNVSIENPLLVWQYQDSGPDKWGQIYLTSSRKTTEGKEYSGVVGEGKFIYPYSITSDGINFYEALKWFKFQGA